jgi:hypothetical protein
MLARSAVPAAAAQDEWSPPPGWSTAPGGANSSGSASACPSLRSSRRSAWAPPALARPSASWPPPVLARSRTRWKALAIRPVAVLQLGTRAVWLPVARLRPPDSTALGVGGPRGGGASGVEAERMRVAYRRPPNAQPLRLGHGQRGVPAVGPGSAFVDRRLRGEHPGAPE